ncbi:MAG: Holliday junction branch migration protein RuvA [Tissierellaceae bacterium]|nr:Holliday junction branch migration protein RuvA [Tissierellaceae bacterium]
MFEFIIGDIVDLKDDYFVLQNNNIGYKVFTSVNSMVNLELGMKNAMIFTYLNVREDGIYLYGFTTKDEIDMFKLLQFVSKIGPKVALGVLSTLTPNQIKRAILSKQIDILCKAPGVGKKTAERIVLELKDRIDKDIEIEDTIDEQEINIYPEAVNGLMSLGYSRIEIDKAIRGIDISNLSVEGVIREVLKKLSKN